MKPIYTGEEIVGHKVLVNDGKNKEIMIVKWENKETNEVEYTNGIIGLIDDIEEVY